MHRTDWKPTHRLMATIGQPKTVHVWLVMLTTDGHAYTRHDLVHNLPPSLQRANDTHWLYCNPETQKGEMIVGTLKPLQTEFALRVNPPAWRALRRVS